jgi:hypothetical protein
VDLGKTLELKRRERELACDGRAGSWARASARAKQRAFLRANWCLITGFAAFLLAVGVGAGVTTHSDFLRGLILGIVLATAPAVIWSWTVQVTGTGPIMVGDQAEQWSAQELRKLRRHGWRLVNHFLLKRDDVDHVLIGPAGVWAVETKWSASWDTAFARDRERDAVRQVRSSAHSMSLWDPMRKRGLNVHPVVVLWGGGLRDWAPADRARMIDGVPVVVGLSFGEWMPSLTGGVLETAEVDDVWTVMETQSRVRDAPDQEANPVATSFSRYLARVGAGVVGGYAALLAAGQVWDRTHAIAWVIGLSVASLVPAGVLARLPQVRVLAWGWIAGVGISTVVIVVAEGLNALR